MNYRHFFFDMDKTVAPARQPILPEMHALLNSLTHDLVIVSGQTVDKIEWQSNRLKAGYLGQNGNHALDEAGVELWDTPLTQAEIDEVLAHIDELRNGLDEQPRNEHNPIENRGGQITFSPIGNTAPVALKSTYDPDRKKRLTLMNSYPFVSETMMVLIGGSTSLDYIPKERHKGTNVKKYIEHKGWNAHECVYFGDGLFPGGNDEFVIGVIDTIAVEDHIDCFAKIQALIATQSRARQVQ